MTIEKQSNLPEEAPKTPETLTDVQQNFLANFKDNPEKMWEIIEKNTPLPPTKAESELLALKDRDPVATADEVLLAIQKISKEKQEILLAELAKSEKTNETSKEKFTITATTTNAEFLNVPFRNRLPAITKPPIETTEIKSGTEIKLNFDYDGDGKQDKSEFYRKTTAGQILPENVMAVKSNNQEYKRDSLKGEFFDENGRRLVIHHNTVLTIALLRSEAQLKVKHKENKEKFKEFQEKNPNADDVIIKEALARGIDPQFALLAFSDKTKEAGIEDAFTEFDRASGIYGVSKKQKNGKHSIEFAQAALYKIQDDKEAVKKSLGAYGFSKEEIESAHKKLDTFNGGVLPEGPVTDREREKLRNYFNQKGYHADNLVECYDFFVKIGLTKIQSLGIIANICHESGGDHKASPSKFGRSEPAFGIVQMHPDRRKRSGYGNTLQSQLNAIVWEFGHTHNKAFEALKGTKTAYEAAAVFCKLYEIPANKEQQAIKRGKFAENLSKIIYPHGVDFSDLNRKFKESISGLDEKDYIEHQNFGPKIIRNQPIHTELKERIMRALKDTPYKFVITSGGQKAHGKEGVDRTGSHRHNHGHACDGHFVNRKTGYKLTFDDKRDSQDRREIQELLYKLGREGINGIGAGEGYMGNETVHIGGNNSNKYGGKVQVWGANGKGKNAPQWLRDAVDGSFRYKVYK